MASLALLWQSITALPIGLVGLTILLLTFPDGKLLKPRWIYVALASAVAIPIYVLLATFRPGPFQTMPYLDNPRGAGDEAWRLMGPVMWFSFSIAVLALLASFASLILRLRSVHGADRQYIKRLLYSMALFVLGVFVQQSGYALSIPGVETMFLIGFALQIIAFSGVTTAIAIAIYKYQLYDIDIIINRPLVYGC